MRLANVVRCRETPVICRVQEEPLVFDCRTPAGRRRRCRSPPLWPRPSASWLTGLERLTQRARPASSRTAALTIHGSGGNILGDRSTNPARFSSGSSPSSRVMSRMMLLCSTWARPPARSTPAYDQQGPAEPPTAAVSGRALNRHVGHAEGERDQQHRPGFAHYVPQAAGCIAAEEQFFAEGRQNGEEE